MSIESVIQTFLLNSQGFMNSSASELAREIAGSAWLRGLKAEAWEEGVLTVIDLDQNPYR